MEARYFPLSAANHNHTGPRLDGKVAVVTGGGSGIGRSVALTFARCGAKVHLLDVDRPAAEATAQEIACSAGQVIAHECDVSDSAQVTDVLCAIQRQGGVDVLVNNAGVPHIGRVDDTTEADFDRLFAINVKGVFNCMRACIGEMQKRRGGVILNMASIAAVAGISDRFAYSMTKGAVLAMTLSVARDYLQYNIRCNCISPARVHTPFVDSYLRTYYPGREEEMFEKLARTQPIGRMAEPEEIASLARFLCSDAAAFITGANYLIDGGFVNLRG